MENKKEENNIIPISKETKKALLWIQRKLNLELAFVDVRYPSEAYRQL